MLASTTKQGQNTSNSVSAGVSDTKDINIGNVRMNVGRKLDENEAVIVGAGKETITEGDTRNLGNVNKVIIANGVQKIEKRAFENCENLEEVVLNEDLGEISNYAFKNCSNLAEMSLPGSIRNIGRHAFYGCENLNKMELKQGITETFSYAFRDCKGLKELSLSGSIKTIGWRAFSHFNSLKKVEINEGTEKISRAAFIGCKNLETVKLPNSIKWIGKYAFQNCKNLKTVDTTLKSNVCDEKAFKGCESLELGDAFKYTEIVNEDRFYMKKDTLIKIDASGLPLFGESGPDEEDVQQGSMGDCWMLAAIASIAYMKPDFMKNMIKDNPENPDLVDVTLQRKLTSGVFRKEVYTLQKSLFKTKEGSSLMSESKDTIWVQMLEKAYSAYLAKGKERINYNNIDGGGTGIKNAYKVMLGKEARGMYFSPGLTVNREKLFSKIKNALNHGIPLWYADVNIIKKGMSYIKCDIPERVKDIDGEDVVSFHSYTLMDAYERGGRYYIVLRNPWGLNRHGADRSVIINTKSAYITVDLEEATKGLFSISNLGFKEDKTIPEGSGPVNENEDKAVIGKDKEVIRLVDTRNLKETSQVTIEEGIQRIGERAFSGFRDLKKIIIPRSVKKIGKYAFNECENLEEVELREEIKEISEFAFYNCKKLRKIIIPESVEKIGGGTFSGCESLRKVEIKGRIKEIYYSTFRDCKKLEEISIPESVENIGLSTFSGCESLKEIELKGKVKEMGASAFQDCKKLKKISIPESVENIWSSAFKGCECLEEIEIKNPNTQINKYAFRGCKSLKKIDVLESVDK